MKTFTENTRQKNSHSGKGSKFTGWEAVDVWSKIKEAIHIWPLQIRPFVIVKCGWTLQKTKQMRNKVHNHIIRYFKDQTQRKLYKNGRKETEGVSLIYSHQTAILKPWLNVCVIRLHWVATWVVWKKSPGSYWTTQSWLLAALLLSDPGVCA